MAEGHFDQLKSLTRFLKGFGSRKSLDLVYRQGHRSAFKPFGVRLMAINTSGKTDQEVEFIGTLAD